MDRVHGIKLTLDISLPWVRRIRSASGKYVAFASTPLTLGQTRVASPPRPTPAGHRDLAGFPHILETILDQLDYADLLSMRLVSPLISSMVDAMLCRHVVAWADGRSLEFYRFGPIEDGPSRRIPGLRWDKHPQAQKRCKAFLSHTRTLDVFLGQLTPIQNALCNVRTLRQLNTFAEARLTGGQGAPSPSPSPLSLNCTTRIDVIRFQESYWRNLPLAHVQLTQRSVQLWVLHIQLDLSHQYLTHTAFEVNWPDSGPTAMTIIVSCRNQRLESRRYTQDHPPRLGLLHDLVLLIAANWRTEWTLVLDLGKLPAEILGCEDLDGREAVEYAIVAMVEEVRGRSADIKFYDLDGYRTAVGDETFALHCKAFGDWR